MLVIFDFTEDAINTAPGRNHIGEFHHYNNMKTTMMKIAIATVTLLSLVGAVATSNVRRNVSLEV